MPYRLCIFDFDGTLADSADWMIRTFNEIAAPHGLRRVSEAEVQMLRGRTNRDIVRYLGVPAWKIPIIAADVRSRISADVAHIRLFAGVDRLLSILVERGMRTAIVSSNSEENIRLILGPENAARIHDYECGASIFGKARKLRRVIERSGIPARETICIGDETRDIEAAKGVGAASGAVLWGYANADLLKQHSPTMAFATMTDIETIAI